MKFGHEPTMEKRDIKTERQALVLNPISKFPAKLVKDLHHNILQVLAIFLQEAPLFLFR
jgi:hypothetical protein